MTTANRERAREAPKQLHYSSCRINNSVDPKCSCGLEDWITLALDAKDQQAEALREALEIARPTLVSCRRLFGGAGMGGPGAMEADCDFAIRKIDAALARAERQP